MKMIFVLATLTVASTSLINNFDYQILSAPVTYGRVADRIIDFKYFQITIEKNNHNAFSSKKMKRRPSINESPSSQRDDK